MAEARKIAMLGGTFDPIHLGHIHLAELAKSAFALDEVRFIPCRISPHKGGCPPTPAKDRIEMLHLATSDLPWAVIDDIETRREGPSYSWQTAEEMKSRFPDARLFWIMGNDQWEALHDWTHPERLAAAVEFIVFARANPPRPREGFVFHTVEGDHPASATAIREAIAAGENHHRWLHPDVSSWITEHELYQPR